MEKLNLKPTHKLIRDYYEALEQFDRHNITPEGAVSNPFAQGNTEYAFRFARRKDEVVQRRNTD